MRRRWRIERIGLASMVKTGFLISAAAGFVLGLFWGVVFTLFASFLAAATSVRAPGAGLATVMIMPVFGAVFSGFIGAAAFFLAGLAYNLAAGAFGGLELEIETGESEGYPVDNRSVAERGAVSGQFRRIWKPPPIGLAYRTGIARRRGKTGV
jgi:hypothetical protein